MCIERSDDFNKRIKKFWKIPLLKELNKCFDFISISNLRVGRKKVFFSLAKTPNKSKTYNIGRKTNFKYSFFFTGKIKDVSGKLKDENKTLTSHKS